MRHFHLDYDMRTSKYEKLARHIDELSDTISRSVKVELVVNGYPVDAMKIEADGTMQKIAFETKI